MKSGPKAIWLVLLWITAAAVQWLLFGWVGIFWVGRLRDIVLPLVLPAIVLGVTWRWFDGRRENKARLHTGQIAVWWAWAACAELLLLRIGVWLDPRIPSLSTEGSLMLALFLLVMFIWIPARMLRVTWVWARSGE